MKRTAVCLLVLGLAAVEVAVAQSGVRQQTWRCGRELVRVGESTWELLQTCGEPDFKETVALVRDSAGIAVVDDGFVQRNDTDIYRTVERWHYNGTDGRLDRSLTIEGGTLIEILVHGK